MNALYKRLRIAPFLIAISLHFTPAYGQNQPQTGPDDAAAACADPRALSAAHFYGRWDVYWLDAPGAQAPATPAAELRLGPNPEHPDSVRGTLHAGGETAWIAGDVDEDGDFALEQSADGTHIDATWIGPFTEGSCAHEARGIWTRAADGLQRPYLLRQRRAW